MPIERLFECFQILLTCANTVPLLFCSVLCTSCPLHNFTWVFIFLSFLMLLELLKHIYFFTVITTFAKHCHFFLSIPTLKGRKFFVSLLENWMSFFFSFPFLHVLLSWYPIRGNWKIKEKEFSECTVLWFIVQCLHLIFQCMSVI